MPQIHLESLPRRVTKTDLLTFVETVGGLSRRRVGRIELRGASATVEVPDSWPSRLAKALDGQRLDGRPIRVWADAPAGGGAGDEDHFQRLTRLLELERRAEAQETLQRMHRLPPHEAEHSGTALVDLAVTDEDTGLGGRYLVQLRKRKGGPLPWTRLTTGTPVLLSPQATRSPQASRGVVYEQTDNALRVALDTVPDGAGEYETWRLDLANDEVALQRQRSALQRASLLRGDRSAQLRDVLLGDRLPEFSEPEAVAADGLNLPQQQAVQFALGARDVALIHGPPGTGKTTAIVALILAAVARGEQVLACAPSNVAVDNIFERLIAARAGAVRLGHPARVLPELRAHTLDLLVEQHEDVRLARKLVKQAMGLFRQAGRTTRARPAPGARQQLRQEARAMLADARRMEIQAVDHVLDSASILCATTTGLDSEVIGARRFDLAVIDEACQSVEPGCWIPLLRCDRLVLAGDHCQLPPTVISQQAAAEGLGISLFERLMAQHGESIARRLTVQYRMHEAIMRFSSAEFYEGQLLADESVRCHVLCDLPGIVAAPWTESPLEFIDTAGASFDEELEPDGQSRLNRQEAALVVRKVQQLLAAGLRAADIAVIAPYAAQVRALREQLGERGLEIDSVDGFQGREKEAVVISLVRSNPQGEIGFLGDVRRMNVAMTRARRKLLIVGDSATLGRHPFYRRALDYFESCGAYRSVWEEDEVM